MTARQSSPETRVLPTRPASWAELEQRFDACYSAASRLNAEHQGSLCAIGNGTCARSQQRSGVAPFCCGAVPAAGCDFAGNVRCPHVNKAGCTVQSLLCRLWFCDAVAVPVGPVSRSGGVRGTVQTARLPAFRALVWEADYYGFLVHRGTREESLRQAAAKWGIVSELQGQDP